MLLTLTTTHRPATDLGFLLGKNPARAQSFDLSVGTAHVLYPEVSEARTTAAVLLEVDPIGLVRGTPDKEAWVEHYVNDRPYAASSLLSVSLARVLREAMAGKSRDRPELAQTPLPLEAHVYALPGSDELIRALFEPLGYRVSLERPRLDPRFPEWGESGYANLTLEGTVRLSELLAHLYVLIPVLDDEKHYWVGEAEVEKLLARGSGWLERHPLRETIARRYLKHRRDLAGLALERLGEAEAAPEALEAEEERLEEVLTPSTAENVPRPPGLHEQRLEAVTQRLLASGARRVLDLGCGEGKLMRHLLKEAQFEHILGVDVSPRTLERAERRLKLEKLPEKQQARVQLVQGSLTCRDRGLEGFEAAALVEVIEHLEPWALSVLERSVFEFARPRCVVVTTPNREYNALFPTLEPGAMRHRDHRFEWTRTEFRAWAERVGSSYGYALEFFGVGPEDAERGAPSQGAVFRVNS